MLIRGKVVYHNPDGTVKESAIFKKYQYADETLRLKSGDLLPDMEKDFAILKDFADKFNFKIIDSYLSYHIFFGYHIATIEVYSPIDNK